MDGAGVTADGVVEKVLGRDREAESGPRRGRGGRINREVVDGRRVDSVDLAGAVAIAAAQQHAQRVAVEIGHGDIGSAVAVDVAHRQGNGLAPTAKVCWVWKVPLPLPSSTLTVSLPLLATTMSGLPSPLTSATATENGLEPVAKVCWVWKVPLPLPSSTLTVSLA